MRDNKLEQGQDRVFLHPYSMPQTRFSYSDGAFAAEQTHINCYPVVTRDQVTGEASYDVVKRPGTIATLPTTIGALGTNNRMFCMANMCVSQLYDVNVAAFFDGSAQRIYIVMYRPIANNATLIGTIGNNPPELAGAFNCNLDDKVFITEGTTSDSLLPMIAVSYQQAGQAAGAGYYAITNGSGVFTAASLTRIASVSFPSNLGTPRIVTGPFQYLNGHFYIMTLDGYIYMSSLTAALNPDITTWNTLATVVASQYPDKGVGVFRYKHHLLAFGSDSVEFFQDASNPPPGSTLERTDQAFIKFGAIMPKMIVNVDDTVYWIAYGSSAVTGLWKMDGYTPTRVSTAREDFMIANALATSSGNTSYWSLEVLELFGKKHILINGIAVVCLAGQVDSAAIATASAADTYPISSGDLSGYACFSVEDRVWWGINSCGAVAIIPTSTFPTVATAGQYRQYCFRRGPSATATTDVSATKPFYFELGAGTIFGDTNVDGAANPTPYAVIHQFNTVYFETERRKFFSKLRLHIDPLTTAAVPGLYVGINTKNSFSGTGLTAIRPLPASLFTVARYYLNRLGSGRSFTLYYVYKSIGPFRGRGAEIELHQGMS